MIKCRACVLGACVVAAVGSTVSATPLPFAVYENADSVDVSALSLWVNIAAGPGATVDFTFHNNSSGASILASVTAIYFEATTNRIADGSLPLGLQSGVVSFSPGASPSDPKGGIQGWGGNLAVFGATAPSAHNGIGPGEWRTVRFDLVNGTVNDVIDDLNNGVFRIAQHVQRLGSNEQSSVWTTIETVVIPLPGVAGLGALGLGLVAIRRRR